MRRTCVIAALAVILGSLLLGSLVHADPVVSIYGAANGSWWDGVKALPDDFELGGTASASLQPHLSLVGNGFYGLNNSYLRGGVGVRVTATNVDDPDFSIGLGAQYHFSSEPSVRPEGLGYDASMGWRAWPNDLPNLTLILQGEYYPAATESPGMAVHAGVRLLLGGNAR